MYPYQTETWESIMHSQQNLFCKKNKDLEINSIQ